MKQTKKQGNGNQVAGTQTEERINEVMNANAAAIKATMEAIDNGTVDVEGGVRCDLYVDGKVAYILWINEAPSGLLEAYVADAENRTIISEFVDLNQF